MIEILAPAGNVDSALAAINNGANAIYLGLDGSFSARQGADNFDKLSFRDILKHAHLCGVKVYVAMNTLIKAENELQNFFADLVYVHNEGADAIILQDIFLGKIIHENYPEIILHLSTQAGVCNIYGAKFAKECGFSRVILARETPLNEIAKIAQIMETEVFVQGALCTCFSGQCYFSSFAGGNSGNRGRCKQPCRKLYAYDRFGNTDKNYALSLSDLCVGEEIQKLIAIGVVSFKIEGRMRRAEYVGAAVRYYRTILDKQGDSAQALSDLKRTYNRGNYTKGLAFGQDKRLLSPFVQGHIGEKVGVVKVMNAKYYVESNFQPQIGDAFKILRDGQEMGGAIFVKNEGKKFIISSKSRLKNGDGVFVTTDTQANARALCAKNRGKLVISLVFIEGQKARASWNGQNFDSDFLLQSALNRPLTKEELIACFQKTDGLPVDIIFDEIDIKGNIFVPKSDLNGFRRKVYQQICNHMVLQGRKNLDVKHFALPKLVGQNDKIAVISNDFEGVNADIAIYKWTDIRLPLPQSFLQGNFEKYIYYPAFATQSNLDFLAKHIQENHLDGIYAENYGGIAFAKELGIKVFAGTGYNLTNAYSIATLLQYPCVSYYTISKELNEKEGSTLLSDKSFALCVGDIKIMDLCYCPFGKTCAKCDKKEVYTLTDENGRSFPVHRIVCGAEDCRFEVYNCANLIGRGIPSAGKLLDLTLTEDKKGIIAALDNEQAQKNIYQNYTSGHIKRGVL